MFLEVCYKIFKIFNADPLSWVSFSSAAQAEGVTDAPASPKEVALWAGGGG